MNMPDRVAKLPRDPRGYPIFKMITYPDGSYNFVGQSADAVLECVKDRLCAICGEELGPIVAFLGPEKIFDLHHKNVSDPPMHRECLEYAIQVCPYILRGGWDRKNEKQGWQGVKGTLGNTKPGKLVMVVVDEYAVFYQDDQPFFYLHKAPLVKKVIHAKIGRENHHPPEDGCIHGKAAKKAARRAKRECAIRAEVGLPTRQSGT